MKNSITYFSIFICIVFSSCSQEQTYGSTELFKRSTDNYEPYLEALILGKGEIATLISGIIDKNDLFAAMPNEVSSSADLIYEEFKESHPNIVTNLYSSLENKDPLAVEQSIRDINSSFFQFSLNKEIQTIVNDSTIVNLVKQGTVDENILFDLQKDVVDKNYDDVYENAIKLDSVITGSRCVCPVPLDPSGDGDDGLGGGSGGGGSSNCVAITAAYAVTVAIVLVLVVATATTVGTSMVAANTVQVVNTMAVTNTYTGGTSAMTSSDIQFSYDYVMLYLQSIGTSINEHLLNRGELPTDNLLLESLVVDIINTL